MKPIVFFAILCCSNLWGIGQDNSQDSLPFLIDEPLEIFSASGKFVTFSKSQLTQIIATHPEFFKKFPDEPDKAYHCNPQGFGGEAGQDAYYILYAYFLKQKNGVEKYQTQRQRLIDIYSSINSLFRRFEYGGTYFGHQGSRIEGYAEYSVYLFAQANNEYDKTYDVGEQKKLYVQYLRQLIEDEVMIDRSISDIQKQARKENLNLIVDRLEKLIDSKFYLGRAQEFHYGHYEYY